MELSKRLRNSARGGMQVATAVGESARAAINAVAYVRKRMKATSLKL